MRFDDYMERCLYDPEAGFYTTGAGAGRADGNFITSPEVGPLFGALVARHVANVWEDLGRPARLAVVEWGAGRGALAKAFLTEVDDRLPELAAALDYHCVERSPTLAGRARELLGDRVAVSAEAPSVEWPSIVVANELLDNLVFRLLEMSSTGWMEVHVDDGQLQLVEPDVSVALPDAPVGTRLPLQTQAADWVDQQTNSATRVIAFDYGTRTTNELIGRDWLRTYASHGRGGDPLAKPGTVDITADVAFDQLPPTTTLTTQAEWLRALGLEELVSEARDYWHEHAASPDLAAFKARSRVGEADALTDEAGLGGFLVAEWENR